MDSSSHKRAREVAAAGEVGSPEAGNECSKRLRPEDLLDMLDDDTDAAAAGDLASVMRSLEEEIGSFDDEAAAAAAAGGDITAAPQPELGFLLEASDDELGLPPAGASSSSEDAGAAEPEVTLGLDEQFWGFEDEIAGGFGGSSPEAAAAIAAAAAAGWDDEGFDAELFSFGDEAFGPSDLAAFRHETMPAV